MKRNVGNAGGNPEVAPEAKGYGGSNPMGAPKNILPYTAREGSGGGSKSFSKEDGMKKVFALAGAVWIIGALLGYGLFWPIYLVLDTLQGVFSIPPLSWIFGLISSPFSWIVGLLHKGAPLVEQAGTLQELRLATDQVSNYMDAYIQQYGDASLIFATHDGYPQIVNGLLYNKDLGMKELIDAADEKGNTALIYAASKGYRQCIAMLLRNGADPDIANHGSGGRTPLMEAAGGGFRDIVSAIRLSKANIEAMDDHGNTALHYAAYYGHVSVVLELLKGNPNTEVKNSQGRTAASYAVSNRHTAVADLINRFSPRKEAVLSDAKGAKQKEASQKEASQKDEDEDLPAPPPKATKGAKQKEAPQKDEDEDLPAPPPKAKKNSPKEKDIAKGDAEDLPKSDSKKSPKSDSTEAPSKPQETVSAVTSPAITANEKKALQDQLAKMKRQHEDAELRAQRKIVELMENNAKQQQSLDAAELDVRTAKLNHTDLSLRVQELESKHHGSELRMQDEKQRADRLEEELQQLRKERDMHAEAGKRHESSLNLAQDEVARQQRELAELREELSRYRSSGDTSKLATPPATPPATTPSPAPTPSPLQSSKANEAPGDPALSTKASTNDDSQGGNKNMGDDSPSDNPKGRQSTNQGPDVEVEDEA